jgi:hypothetical protein
MVLLNQIVQVFRRTLCGRSGDPRTAPPRSSACPLPTLSQFSRQHSRSHRAVCTRAVSAWARLVAGVKLPPVLAELLAKHPDRIRRVLDGSIEPHLRSRRAVYGRRRNRSLMDVQPQNQSILRHGPPLVSGDRLGLRATPVALQTPYSTLRGGLPQVGGCLCGHDGLGALAAYLQACQRVLASSSCDEYGVTIPIVISHCPFHCRPSARGGQHAAPP